MSQQPTSVILGAGLMGRLLACRLAQAGHRVVVHEAAQADAQGAAARAAAAMLAPLAESAITELPVVKMGAYGLTAWPRLMADLPEPVFFQQAGTLILWHRQDVAEAQRFQQLIQRTAQAMPNLPGPQAVDAEQLATIEPGLRHRFMQGLYLPGEGQLDNRQLLTALLKAMLQHGVDIHFGSAKELSDFQPGAAGHPDWLFDCRGLGGKPAWTQLRGVRGEVIRLHAPQVDLSRPTRLIHPRYPLYIAPKQDHVFVIGATEIETDDLSPASVRSTLELLSAAYTVHSGFAEARILEITTQARPTLPDNMPAIHCPARGVVQINGLYRHGFLIAPAMLDSVMEWVDQGTHRLADEFGLMFSAQ